MATTDLETCNKLFCQLDRHERMFNETLKTLNAKEKRVYRVWHFFGILGNGGFREVFSQDVFGSHGYQSVIKDCKTIGVNDIAELVSQAVALKDKITTRENKTQAELDKRLSQIERKIYEHEKDVAKHLAAYIRKHF